MGKIGGGVTLLVVGAILMFALEIDIPGIGTDTLGIILMLAGAVLLVLGLVTETQHRRGGTFVEDRDAVVVDEPARRRRRFL
jgi:uncharacterized membrane protein